jgi:hypothetical protein
MTGCEVHPNQGDALIESVDVTGNAAVAKIVLDYPTTRLTDYFTLLKVDGEWKIMNKIFYAEPKTGN